MIFTDIKKTTHTAGRSYSRPGISEATKETNKPHRLKAQIIRFAQSKFRIVNALHNKNAIREKAEKPLVVQVDSKVTFHTITSSFCLVTSYESCWTCQYFISTRTNHKLGKKLANQKRRHMSLRLFVIQTRYCAVIRRRSIQPGVGGGGVLPYKRLLGMCRWMGSHFNDWIDRTGVAFSTELLESRGRTFSDFWGRKILCSLGLYD